MADSIPTTLTITGYGSLDEIIKQGSALLPPRAPYQASINYRMDVTIDLSKSNGPALVTVTWTLDAATAPPVRKDAP